MSQSNNTDDHLKTLSEFLSTEKGQREFAGALVTDQMDERQQRLYQEATGRFFRAIDAISMPVDESLEKNESQPLSELLSTDEGQRKFAAVLAADEMNLVVTNGQGDFLEGKITLDLPLTFETYQAGAKETAIYNQDARVLYPVLGLTGEVGELGEKVLQMAIHAGKAANQVKKIIRGDDCECDTPRKHDIGKEIGGVLWYCAAVCSDLGLSLGDIAQENLDILGSRQERGTLKGDGDNR